MKQDSNQPKFNHYKKTYTKLMQKNQDLTKLQSNNTTHDT